MHYPPTGLLALLYICAAWPVQDVSMPRSLALNNPPARISSSSALHSDLRLPISPDHGGNLLVYPSMHHRMGTPPKRSELAMTLAIGAYWYWMEMSNGALKHHRAYRGKPPFANFKHEIFPANLPAAPLTPVKLGTAYCRMLLYVLSREITSGLLTARLLTETNRVMIGIVSIENKPEFGKVMSSISSKEFEQSAWANQTFNPSLPPDIEGSALQASDETQRRWFGCLARMLFSIMANNQAALVEEQMSSQGLPSKTYHFPCNDTDLYNHDYVALTIYLAASRCALTWRQLAEQLVVLGSAVAIGHSARTIVPVKSSGTLLATLMISVDG